MNTLPSDILQIIYKDNSIIRLLSKEIRTLLSVDYSTLVLNYYDTTDSLNVNVAKLEYVNTTKTYNHLRLLSLYPKVIRFLDIKTNKLSICPNEHCYKEEKYVMKRKLPPLKELYITDNVGDHTFIIDKNTEIVKIALVSEKDFAHKSLINLQSINDLCLISFELIFCNSKYSDEYCRNRWLSFFDSINVSNKKVIYEFENKRVSLFKSIFVPKKKISTIYHEKENYIVINKNDTNVSIDLTFSTSTNIVIKGNNSSLNELFIKSASNGILKLEFYQDTFESIKRFYINGNFRFVNKLNVCQIKDLISCDIRLDGDSHRIRTSKNTDSKRISIVETNYNDLKSDFPSGVDKIKIILFSRNECAMYVCIFKENYLVEEFSNLEILDLLDLKFNYLEISSHSRRISLLKIILKTKNELLNVIVGKNVSVTFSNKVKIQNLYLMDEYSIINGDYVILNLFCQVTYNTKNINYISKYIISSNNY